MHEGVVPPAEQDAVVEIGRAAVHPVLDVVCVEESRMGAARERASALVSDLERAPHPRRHRARPSTRSHYPTPTSSTTSTTAASQASLRDVSAETPTQPAFSMNPPPLSSSSSVTWRRTSVGVRPVRERAPYARKLSTRTISASARVRGVSEETSKVRGVSAETSKVRGVSG